MENGDDRSQDSDAVSSDLDDDDSISKNQRKMKRLMKANRNKS